MKTPPVSSVRCTSADLARAGLADGLLRVVDVRIVSEDREDRADADARVEVRAAVERIEHDAVLAALVAAAEDRRLVVLFTREHGDRCTRAKASDERLVRDHIELLLLLALHIRLADPSDRAREARTADLVGDRLRGERDRADDPGEVAARGRELGLLEQDVALEAHQVLGEVVAVGHARLGLVKGLGGGENSLFRGVRRTPSPRYHRRPAQLRGNPSAADATRRPKRLS